MAERAMLPYLLLTIFLFLAHVPKSPDVILITIDGVRWQEVFNGTDPSRDQGRHLVAWQLVPNLYTYFVGQGIAVGRDSPMVASGPNHVSLPGYLEITRGHPSFDCQSNDCSPSIDASVFWFFQHPAVFGSWNGIAKTIPPFPNTETNIGDPYRWDVETKQQTLRYLESHHPDFLWVALGDTDELAHRNDYPAYLKALQDSDAFIGDLVKRYPNATFIITCDHGRSANFTDHGMDQDSERVWLMMHGPTVPSRGFVKAFPISLSNILPTITDLEFGSHSSGSILSKVY